MDVHLVTTYLCRWPGNAPSCWRGRATEVQWQDPDDSIGPAIHCTGTLDGDVECGAILSHAGALLSNRHRWDAGRGNEPAVYLNYLQSGAVTSANPREMALAQGPMQVTDAHCAACGQRVGWHFLRPAGGNRSSVWTCWHHEGRHGLVRSAIKCDADLWFGISDSDGDSSDGSISAEDD